ncbi:hypothetical protein Tco_0667176 [Tanacetum coccineum]
MKSTQKERKSRESSIGDSDNTRDGGKTAVKELCKQLGSEGGESLRCSDAKLTLEMGQKERNGVAGLIGHE